MPPRLFFLSIPGLRKSDLASMPLTGKALRPDTIGTIQHSFPSVTWPAQATMLTGSPPNAHGIVANGIYWRETHHVEMWTAWNEVIEHPQLWDLLKERDEQLVTAAWFPMLAKGCHADLVCMPAPIHKPDGREELWCHTKPQEHYGDLLALHEHFPLHHFWGPLANIKSTAWIVDSFVTTAEKFGPHFSYIYLPHLDYAAQKFGPDSHEALAAVAELDEVLARLIGRIDAAFPAEDCKWLLVSEYVIQNVDGYVCPNRILRKAGLLTCLIDGDGRERIDFKNTPAWALADHQFSHVYVRDSESETVEKVIGAFQDLPGIANVVAGDDRKMLGMDHERSGDVILISDPNSWQAYYWWEDDRMAPMFARTVDIHRKPGYDPVELFFDPATREVPLRPELIKGSHGVITNETREEAVWLTRNCNTFATNSVLSDLEIAGHVLREFGF